MLVEEWRPIPYLQNRWVSNTGRIRNATKELRLTGNGNGYLRVNVRNKTYYIHRLVAEAFLGPSILQVNHKDGNNLNNRIDNLEYVSPTQNMEHASRNDLLSKTFTNEQIQEIRAWHAGGVPGSALARLLGVRRSTIQNITVGRSRKWEEAS